MIDVKGLRELVAMCGGLTVSGYAEAWSILATAGNTPRWLIVPPQLHLTARMILRPGSPVEGSADIIVVQALADQPARWYVASETAALAFDR